MAPTKQIILTTIVHRTRDCVGIIAGVQHIDGPLQVKHWGVRTPVSPAAIMPMDISLLQEPCDEALALTVLQSVIRGCAINTEMADGLSLKRGIMLELRTTHPLWEDSRAIMVMREQRQRLAEEHRQEVILHVRFDNFLTLGKGIMKGWRLGNAGKAGKWKWETLER